MRGWAALCLSFLLSFPLTAGAEESKGSRAAARDLGGEGVAAYKRGAYADALDKLERAYEVVRVPSLGLWSARALVKLGRWVEASERYVEIARLDVASGNPTIQEKAKKDAEAELAELRPRIPLLELTISGVPRQDVTINLDGSPLSAALVGTRVPIDPGQHRLEVRYADQVQPADVVAVEAQVVPVDLEFRKVASPSSPASSSALTAPTAAESTDKNGATQRTIGWVAVGVGSVGLAAGGVAGLLALSEHGKLESSCQAGSCFADKADQVDTYNTTRRISSVGLIAGGLIAATGVVLVLSAPKQRSLSLVVAPRALALRGSL